MRSIYLINLIIYSRPKLLKNDRIIQFIYVYATFGKHDIAFTCVTTERERRYYLRYYLTNSLSGCTDHQDRNGGRNVKKDKWS